MLQTVQCLQNLVDQHQLQIKDHFPAEADKNKKSKNQQPSDFEEKYKVLFSDVNNSGDHTSDNCGPFNNLYAC